VPMINGREVGNSKMTNRQTVAVSDDEGSFLWFSVDDAQRWSGRGGDVKFSTPLTGSTNIAAK